MQFRAGGWGDQPAALLVQLEFLDLVESTWRYLRSPNVVMEKMSQLQRDLVVWLESDDRNDEG